MFARKFWVSLVTTSLILVPVQRAQANDAAALLGGAILGGIIVNEVNKNNQRKRAAAASSARSSAAYAAQREENRQVQTALNYFGYNVGAPDGSIGPKTRGGIARYQADMGFNPDGALDIHERDFLLNSYQRAQVSAHMMPYSQIVATQGTPGLLRTYRNEQLGIATANPMPQTVPATVPQTVPQTVPPMTQAETVTRREAPAPAPAALPSFTTGASGRSISDLCNEVNVLTAANGGITPAASVDDPEFALNEQFCLARTHAMAESTALVSTVANMTDDQIISQCEGLTAAMADQVAGIGQKQAGAVIGKTTAFLQGSGQSMDQLVTGGKICLGVGYRIDNPEMALASAVLLAGAGQTGYAELVSHQMREGFGTPRAAMASVGWMQVALDSAAQGGPAMTGQTPDRIAVLTAAIKGGGSATSTSALPTFPKPAGN